MFRKSRRKIVAAIMMILVIIWAGTLSVIYLSSYREMALRNESMLKAYAEDYTLAQEEVPLPEQPKLPLNPIEPPGNRDFFGRNEFPGDPGFTETPMFKLSIFYAVALSYDGQLLALKNTPFTVLSDGELETLAKTILYQGKVSGREKNLSYYKADKGEYVLVAFMDNTVVNENAMTLFRFTLVFGGITLLLFFFLSVFLAKKIVGPLEESYEKQKQFISDAGHELKTPVSIVNANAELLGREIGENQWLSNIQYENERMGTLIQQLLELARTENVTRQPERLDFSHLVAGEILPFEGIAYEKGLMLQSEISASVWVEGDASQLMQLTSILLDNAIRHSRDTDRIWIELSKEHGIAVLSVKNKGTEIPKEQREKIFDRFYRLDHARNGEDKHYGLGLAIAKAITIAHRGTIKVKCYDDIVEFMVKIPMVQKNRFQKE